MVARCVLVVAVLTSVSVARAELTDKEKEAKLLFERATTAFGLGHFDEAAADYEKAFELKADPALLYNAAQSHRQGSNKKRALTLYQNYLRIFSKAPNRDEVKRHIASLRQAIASEPEKPPAPEPLPAPTPQPQKVEVVVVNAPPPAPPPDKPIYKKGWFWGVIAGAAVVVGGGIALGVVFGSTEHDPTATLGGIRVRN